MKAKATILVVDDEVDFREDVMDTLKDAGYRVLEAENGEAAVELAQRHTVDVGLLDLVMPGMNGVETMQALQRIDAVTQFVILTGQASVESAVAAMQKGAADYLTKPARLDELEAIVERACQTSRLARQNRAYRTAQERKQRGRGRELIAVSEAMKHVVKQAEALARMDFPVLIQGETGTGKEVVAELIHANSDRADMPLTVLNCAALPETLVDAELFGHEKGTYTGAGDARPGMIEVADGGTLLLDEIGDMPMDAQARLLRFLEKGTFRRLGARVEKAVDVRVFAATNRTLADDVKEGRFREDLYHRLRVYELTVPPLRDHVEVILPLAQDVLDARSGLKGQPLELGPTAADALHAYAWPGNVRELLHTIERAAFASAMANSATIEPEHLNLPVSKESPMVLDEVVKAVEQAHVAKVLALTGGNRREAAKLLGVSERKLYRLLEE